ALRARRRPCHPGRLDHLRSSRGRSALGAGRDAGVELSSPERLMSLPAQGMPEMPMEFDDFGRTAVVSEVMSGLPGESRACRTGATARRRAVYAPGDVAVAGSAGVHGSDIGNHNGNGENVIHGPSTVAGS